jgi:hypothetical protein
MLRPEDVETKNRPPKEDAKEAPRHLRKTFIFLADFAFVALRDPSGGHSRHAPRFQNEPKSIEKHCVYKCFEKSRGAMLRPEDVETKN